jgi:endonuclease/exonuclease/phosphatase family metal-dependent hydrolase
MAAMREIRLKVLSWNLHGLAWPLSKDPNGRMGRVSAKVRELGPDIVLLQEVWLGSQVNRLNQALHPDWIPISVKRWSGGPKGGLLTFASASEGWLPCTPPQFHAFAASAPVWKIWEGDGLGGKGILSVELERGEQRISAVNTHLQSQYSGSNYAGIREAQLIELREFISNSHSSLPAIVAGDFNTDSRESLYSYVTALGTDLTADARRPGHRGTTANPRDGRPEWIDYIVAVNSPAWTVSAELELVANQRADVPYSDHSGLFCTLRLALTD